MSTGDRTGGPFFPAGIKYLYLVDINQFLNASISKVLHTLVECFSLVFLVIFIFLQDFRSTIIHGISVPWQSPAPFLFVPAGLQHQPAHLICSCAGHRIVVDDAVVVVEAVHAKLESGYKSPVKLP